MEAQPRASARVSAFVCLSLMSDKDGGNTVQSPDALSHKPPPPQAPRHDSQLNANHTDIAAERERLAKVP